MEELIAKKKLLADLKGIKDMLTAAGDPFLASVINRAIGCVENQPVVKAAESEFKEDMRWTYDCTCCHSVIVPRIVPPDYCPVCGVRTLAKGFFITDIEG